ncbi:MAG: hypothetical protein Q8L48_06310 [Archangium sp.]|nr:hypothetical protein [Archangium sp.]
MLAATAKQRALNTDERHHLELLRDVLVELEALPPPVPEPAAAVVIVQLTDVGEQAAVSEALRQAGVPLAAEARATRAAIVVVDTGTALGFAGAQLVLMNVSGPDALTGKLATLQPAAYVKRRAPVLEVVEAVATLIKTPAAT